MLHRVPAAWRLKAVHPRVASLRFLVMLRQPELRALSHFRMLHKLARRGETVGCRTATSRPTNFLFTR